MDRPGDEELKFRIAAGEKILLRGHALSGKSRFVAEVCSFLGQLGHPTAIVGSQTSLSQVDQLVSELASASQRSGGGALLVDDLEAILELKNGPAIEARLGSAAKERSLGLLITARCGRELLSLDNRGSALKDLVQFETTLPPFTAQALAFEYEKRLFPKESVPDYVRMFGSCFGLAEEARRRGKPDHLLNYRHAERLSSTISEEEGSRLVRIAERQDSGIVGVDRLDSQLSPIVYIDSTGVRIPTSLVDANLLELVLGGRDAWPSNFGVSVRRFASRILGSSDVYWTDRYLGAQLAELVSFLDALARLQPRLFLRLLTGKQRHELSGQELATFKAKLPYWASQHLMVELRGARPIDTQLLHDRQLIFHFRRGGFALPPVDRILCVHAPGNSIDAYLPRTQVNQVAKFWADAAPIT